MVDVGDDGDVANFHRPRNITAERSKVASPTADKSRSGNDKATTDDTDQHGSLRPRRGLRTRGAVTHNNQALHGTRSPPHPRRRSALIRVIRGSCCRSDHGKTQQIPRMTRINTDLSEGGEGPSCRDGAICSLGTALAFGALAAVGAIRVDPCHPWSPCSCHFPRWRNSDGSAVYRKERPAPRSRRRQWSLSPGRLA